MVAAPMRPVPSRRSELGSGVTATDGAETLLVNVRSMPAAVPVWEFATSENVPELLSAALPSLKRAVPATVTLVPVLERVIVAFEKLTVIGLLPKLMNGFDVKGLANPPSDISAMLATDSPTKLPFAFPTKAVPLVP